MRVVLLILVFISIILCGYKSNENCSYGRNYQYFFPKKVDSLLYMAFYEFDSNSASYRSPYNDINNLFLLLSKNDTSGGFDIYIKHIDYKEAKKYICKECEDTGLLGCLVANKVRYTIVGGKYHVPVLTEFDFYCCSPNITKVNKQYFKELYALSYCNNTILNCSWYVTKINGKDVFDYQPIN